MAVIALALAPVVSSAVRSPAAAPEQGPDPEAVPSDAFIDAAIRCAPGPPPHRAGGCSDDPGGTVGVRAPFGAVIAELASGLAVLEPSPSQRAMIDSMLARLDRMHNTSVRLAQSAGKGRRDAAQLRLLRLDAMNRRIGARAARAGLTARARP